MQETTGKADGAFLTIGELADSLGIPHHILRYWETRFPQLKPLQRAGNRRYYRPADAELARDIHRLLYQESYTVKGVQKLLAARSKAVTVSPNPSKAPSVTFTRLDGSPLPETPTSSDIAASLARIKANLESALSRIDAALA